MDTSVIDKVNKEHLHVVLLGAGASKACLPQGDSNGNIIPLMNEIHKVPKIAKFFKENNVDINDNPFEEFYSKMATTNPMNPLVIKLNKEIYNYFDSLILPGTPTIYDYLLLSLRETDVIATFNWDPFIVQAYKRVQFITTKLPKIFFLHGTVSLGICQNHSLVNLKNQRCQTCNKSLDNIQLLYPTSKKDYENDVYIKDQWDALKFYLNKANGLTIFGYAAPESDVAAIELLKDAWGKNDVRVMEEIQIIDIKSRETLKETWKDFIHETHYTTYSDYFDSPIANFPRRISESQFLRYQLNVWLNNHKIEPHLSFNELETKIKVLLKFEN